MTLLIPWRVRHCGAPAVLSLESEDGKRVLVRAWCPRCKGHQVWAVDQSLMQYVVGPIEQYVEMSLKRAGWDVESVSPAAAD